MMLILALLIGVMAGLRAMAPLAAVSWGTQLGMVAPPAWLQVFTFRWTPWVLSLLALAELITDQLPQTPSRRVPAQFGTRIVVGAICGAAIASTAAWAGLAAGAVGAVIGTLGGAAARARLAAAFGRDLPAALIEDAVAIMGTVLIVAAA